MSKAHITSPTVRLCGHTEAFCFSSSGRTGRVSDGVYAATTLCRSCCLQLKTLMEAPGKGFYPVKLPTLVGRERAVTWAKSIRLATLRAAGPIMASLKQSVDPFAPAALAAFEMLFKITSAQFWIAGREFPYEATWVTSEIEHLLRPRTLAMHQDTRSAFCYWAQVDNSVIRDAREAVKTLRDEHHDSSTAVLPNPTPAGPSPASIHSFFI